MNVPLVHKICECYKKFYLILPQIPKKDRYGIGLKIENIFIEAMVLIIEACFEEKSNKLLILKSVRMKIEVLKRLIRILNELKILKYKKYLELTIDLQEISKMTNGWIKYLKQL